MRRAGGLLLACAALGCAPTGEAPDPNDVEFRLEHRPEPDPGPQMTGDCNPLEAVAPEIELESPILVGVGPDETAYVLDRVGRGPRTFIGQDGVLARQADGGSSQSDKHYSWNYHGGDAGSFMVRYPRAKKGQGKVDLSAVEMAVLTRNPVLGHSAAQTMERGTPLRMVESDFVEGWRVENRDPQVRVEYLAEVEDGTWLLVTMPRGDFDNIRLFYGPKSDVDQHSLWSFGRQRDGGTTNITFFVDGELARAHFPIRCGEPIESGNPMRTRRDCPGTLTLDGTELRFERRDDSALNRLEFQCGTQEYSVTAKQAHYLAKAAIDGESVKCRSDGPPESGAIETLCWSREDPTHAERLRVDLKNGDVKVVESLYDPEGFRYRRGRPGYAVGVVPPKRGP